MEQLQNETQPHTSTVARWWTDPFLLGFGVLYSLALTISAIVSQEWSLFGFVLLALIPLILFLTRRVSPQPVDIKRPSLECWIAIGWYLSYMLLSTIWKGEGILANEFGKWLWFVVLPLGLLVVARGRKPDVIAVLRSIGFHRHGMGKAVLLGFVIGVFINLIVIWFYPASELQKLWEILQKPLNLLIRLPIAFTLALITAGFTEEVLFRGIIQSRLARVTGSELRGCILAAFLFGIYHLPYAYFSPSWPTHGNLALAVSAVLTEQMITGVVLGVLWLRTHNLAAPMVFHALVNTLTILTMLKFG
jgi:membrane protease YdiL (CAAX protease family)